MEDFDRELLQRFCAKVQELEDMRFLRQARSTGIKFRMEWDRGGPMTQTRHGPDEESVKAFLLTLRFFLQDNEPTSIRKIAKLVQISGVRQDLKDRFEDERNALNRHLDSSGNVNVVASGHTYTRRDVLYTFLYGLYAHHNEQYALRLKLWRSSGVEMPLRTIFDNVVLNVLVSLHNLRLIGCEILDAA